MDNDLLSIVVAVHNVAPYLDRSIQSVLGQSYRNIEIIIIDDGSTDGSGEICEKYAKLDSRIKLVSQANQGLASAWKTGVQYATGTYLGFVDPDDYIDDDMYEQLMNHRADFDMVIAQWIRETDSGTRRCYDTFRLGAYRTPEDMDFLVRHLINVSLPGGDVNIQPGIAAYLWNKLFKADVVKCVFEELDYSFRFSNDRPILYSLVLKCKSVLVTNICGYHYQVRSGSLGRVSDSRCDYLQTLCEFYNLMADMFAKDARCDVLMPQLQLKMSEQIAHAPAKMGFAQEAYLQLCTPVFPFLNLLDDKHIVLYGAGLVGRSYRKQIQKGNLCHIDLWVDENWAELSRAGLDVQSLNSLQNVSYDYVLIALESQAEADQVRYDLISCGVNDKDILWKEPFRV